MHFQCACASNAADNNKRTLRHHTHTHTHHTVCPRIPCKDSPLFSSARPSVHVYTCFLWLSSVAQSRPIGSYFRQFCETRCQTLLKLRKEHLEKLNVNPVEDLHRLYSSTTTLHASNVAYVHRKTCVELVRTGRPSSEIIHIVAGRHDGTTARLCYPHRSTLVRRLQPNCFSLSDQRYQSQRHV